MANDWVGNYWRASEFHCTCCGVGGDEMDPILIAVLDECRKQLAVPMQCNSGFRCPSHNSSVGSSSASYHVKKKAADLTFARRTLRTGENILRVFVTLENIGRAYGGLGLGIYPSFVHVDTRTADGEIKPARWSSYNWPRLT